MKRLLVATDHRFVRVGDATYDRYCFTPDFFRDYLAVFDEVEVLCRSESLPAPPDGAHRCDQPRLRFTSVGDPRGAAWQVAASWSVGASVRAAVARSDAVVVRVPSRFGDLASRQAERHSKPFMIEVFGDPREAFRHRGIGPVYSLWAEYEAARLRDLARRCVAASYVNASVLMDAYPSASGVPRDAISSIRLDPSGVAEPRRYDEPPRPLRIVVVASLLPYKRHRDLLDAVAACAASGGDCHVDLVGDGPCRVALLAQAERLGLAGSVTFHGHVAGRDRVNALLDTADLFVLPSATEGLPRAMLEAMSRGVPSIGSRVGGIPELVRPEDSFAAGDVAEITRLLRGLSGDADRLTAMSDHAVRVARRYSNDVLSPKRVALYEHLHRAA